MKQQLMIWPTIVLTTLFLPKNTRLATDELASNYATSRDGIAYSNPLLLINNKPVDYATFSLASKGIVTVVASNPETAQQEKIPFRIYLRRNGSLVSKNASDPINAVLEIDITTVLAPAKPDDYLVVEPVRTGDSKTMRVIKLKPFFNSDLLFNFFRKSGDGC